MNPDPLIPSINPFAIIFTIIMCIIVIKARLEYVVIPLILTICLMTTEQQIVVFNLNFPIIRFLILIGLLRITIRSEWSGLTLNTIDKFMICYIVARTISFTILWSAFSALIMMIGQSIDILGLYFLIRVIICDFNDYKRIFKIILLMSIPVAIFMLYEHISGGYNVFSVLGGVPEMSVVRNGRLRAQGAFNHSILAGTFGASLFPLAWGLRQSGYKIISYIGMLTSLVITIASSSSGPIMTILFAFIGIVLWFFRDYTKLIRNLFIFSLVILHFIMKGPIWSLIARIDLVGGSTGHHRYLLIDAAIKNFSQWILCGIRSTSIWGQGLWDITNQYLVEGARGGIISMILFIFIIIKCFTTIGKVRTKLSNEVYLQKLVWSLGVILFAFIWTFLSVSFFGQMMIFYYLIIAMISSLNNLPKFCLDNNTC